MGQVYSVSASESLMLMRRMKEFKKPFVWEFFPARRSTFGKFTSLGNKISLQLLTNQ